MNKFLNLKSKGWLVLSLLALSYSWAGISFVQADSKKIGFDSGPQKVSVLELYSSEGCSSCPPADEWLAGLRSKQGLWKIFVPVEFHVDYWNQLGWVDPFSNRQFSERQRQYALQWSVPQVYTPAFILNGGQWVASNDLSSSWPHATPGRLRVLQKKENTFEVRFEAAAEKSETFVAYGALLGNRLKQKIPYGENAGRTLKHEFVVLNLSEKTLSKRGSKDYHAELEIGQVTKVKPESFSLAFWVVGSNSLSPLQATGGDLTQAQVQSLNLKKGE